MKLPRPDMASLSVVALCVVGIVVLAVAGVTIPDVLTYVAVGALGISGGTALNTSTAPDTAQRLADALTSVEQLTAPRRRPAPTPGATAGAGYVAGGYSPAPAPRPAEVTAP